MTINALKKYSMTSASEVANQAASEIETFLRNQPATISVRNVEEDEEFRKLDIDLIWEYEKNGLTIKKTIEIKGDRYYHTGNYFFETISNESKQTPGCFLYTNADYVFYYFVDVKELHILPMPEVKDWFLLHKDKYREVKTSTPVGDDFYVTVGRLVPRKELSKAIKNTRIVNLKINIT